MDIARGTQDDGAPGTQDDGARRTRRGSRPAALAAVTVLLLQVVVLGNQGVNDQIFRHVTSQNWLLAYSAAAQSTWRIPRGGDSGYALVADLRAVMLLLLAYVLVRVVARTPARTGGLFLSCWGAIILAAAAAGAVYGVAGRHFISATGLGLFVVVVQTMSAGAGYAVLGGWPAALVAAFVGRRRIGDKADRPVEADPLDAAPVVAGPVVAAPLDADALDAGPVPGTDEQKAADPVRNHDDA